MQISQEYFGQINNSKIFKYTLKNTNGVHLDILNYGGIVHGLWIPDKHGKLANIVLNYASLDEYLKDNAYLGAITGRHAGRIDHAQFKLDGVEYKLAANYGLHNIHGGTIGLNRRIWQVTELSDGIILSYFSPHLEDGFPGNVNFEVCYQLTPDNEVIITSKAYPDRRTLLNLTNHSYFNLSAGQTLANNHLLQINADAMALLDKNHIPTGEYMNVTNTAFDFRTIKKISQDQYATDAQLLLTRGYDHQFLLNKDSPFAARLLDQESGRNLTITTSETHIVFYAGNNLALPHQGICLETQNLPNAINLANVADQSIYSPDKPYQSVTKWQFNLI